MIKRPKIIVSVINDLSTDQRVDKVCRVLHQHFGEVLLVGRLLKNSLPLNRDYRTHRMKLLFTKGPFFYAEYNIRLLFFLLFHKSQLLVSNDLDTLLPNFIVSRFGSRKLVYDSHEYFLGMPELSGRTRVQKVWRGIERRIFPKLTTIITVNQSIADLYEKEYGQKLNVIRNVSPRLSEATVLNRAQLGLPIDASIFILQGAGINMHRGAEEAIEAMQYVDDAILLIIGSGDLFASLPELVVKFNLENKVIIKGRMPYAEMMQYTMNSDVGLSLDKDTNVNYRFSLPNKLFDYIQAGIPVLGSHLTEVARIILDNQIGLTFDDHKPAVIAECMNRMKPGTDAYRQWKANTVAAANELCWENEQKKLIQIYKKALDK